MSSLAPHFCYLWFMHKTKHEVLFTNRIVKQWNQLLSYVVTADNLNVLKSRLDSQWDTIGFGQLQRPLAY